MIQKLRLKIFKKMKNKGKNKIQNVRKKLKELKMVKIN